VKIKLENTKQHTVKRYIVPVLLNQVITQNGQANKTYSLEYSKKKMLYSPDKKTFLPIPYPIKESIGFY